VTAPAVPASPGRVWLALGTVYLVWGSTYLAIRLAVDPSHGAGIPPFLMAALRFGSAGIVMFLATARRPAADGRPDPLGARQWGACAVVGVALLFGGNGLVSVAERRIPSGAAAMVVATVPIWTAVISAAIGAERLRPRAVVGLALGLAGVAVLVVGQGKGRVEPAGVAVVVVAALSWAAGSVYSRRAPLPRRPLTGTAMQMLCATAALLVASAVRGELRGFHPSAVPWSAWAAVAYLAVAGSMVAYSAYVWLLANAPLSLVTTYAYVNPLVAVLLGAAVVSEPLTGRTALAAAGILAGVALIVTRRPPALSQAPGVGTAAADGTAGQSPMRMGSSSSTP
jgi:drug/metabolite transporter (DMT)-like permease